MIKNVIETLRGIDAYGIISVCFFFVLFAGMLIWALRLKKSYLNSMGELPLNDGSVRNARNESCSQPDCHHE